MKRTGLSLILILLIVQPASAVFERTNQGSRAAAMGGALVALTGNEWSVFSNPAALRTIGGRTVSVFYAPQPFGLKELAHGAVSYIEPTSLGVFAASATRFGFELYRETRLSLSYSNEIGGVVKGGINLNHYSLSIQNYGSASTIGVDVGVLVDVSDEISWGFAAFNLNAPTIGSAKEKLPQVFSTGITFTPVREATLAASVVKDIHFPAELHIGVEYSLMEMIALRAGTTSDPNTLNAGLGIHYSFVKLDYALSSHNELGITHQFSLSLNLGEL